MTKCCYYTTLRQKTSGSRKTPVMRKNLGWHAVKQITQCKFSGICEITIHINPTSFTSIHLQPNYNFTRISLVGYRICQLADIQIFLSNGNLSIGIQVQDLCTCVSWQTKFVALDKTRQLLLERSLSTFQVNILQQKFILRKMYFF